MNEMMSSGIELMLIGMGIVYLFLAMLVVCIKSMTAMVERYLPKLPEGIATSTAEKTTEPLVIAAISAAVHQYRNKHNS